MGIGLQLLGFRVGGTWSKVHFHIGMGIPGSGHLGSSTLSQSYMSSVDICPQVSVSFLEGDPVPAQKGPQAWDE